MEYSKQENKLFDYFLNRIEEKDKIKTTEDLINSFENYDIINRGDITDLHDYESSLIERLETFTRIFDLLKTELTELKNISDDVVKNKIDEIIKNYIEIRKNFYLSDNDEPEEELQLELNVENHHDNDISFF